MCVSIRIVRLAIFGSFKIASPMIWVTVHTKASNTLRKLSIWSDVYFYNWLFYHINKLWAAHACIWSIASNCDDIEQMAMKFKVIFKSKCWNGLCLHDPTLAYKPDHLVALWAKLHSTSWHRRSFSYGRFFEMLSDARGLILSLS